MKKLCLLFLILFLTACSTTNDTNTITKLEADDSSIYYQSMEAHHAERSTRFAIFEYDIPDYENTLCIVNVVLKDNQDNVLLSKSMELNHPSKTLTSKNRILTGINRYYKYDGNNSSIFIGFASEDSYDEIYIDFAEGVTDFSFDDYAYNSKSIETEELSLDQPCVFLSFTLHEQISLFEYKDMKYKIEFSISLSEVN